MSTTMTLTMPALPPPRLSTTPCCPKCGTDLSLTFAGLPDANPDDQAATALHAAQSQIDDMQAQIRLLNAKATAAVDRWADYEDELSSLRRELDASRKQQQQQGKEEEEERRRRRRSIVTPSTPKVVHTPTSPGTNGGAAATGSPSPSPSGVSSFATAATNRISALLSRKSTPNLQAQPSPGHQTSYSTSHLLPTPPPSGGHQSSYSTSSILPPGKTNSPLPLPLSPQPLSLSLSSGRTLSYTPGHSPTPSTNDLLDALTREQHLRLAAEGKLNDTSREVEELSVTLFEQANEMVATERRARAKLEERVGELERREGEKKRRLDRLESAVGRIERVRNLLKEKEREDGEDSTEMARQGPKEG